MNILKKMNDIELDAPFVPVTYILCGIVVLIFVIIFNKYDGLCWMALYGIFMIVGGIIFINTSINGKYKIWKNLIKDNLKENNYRVLDLGTGHAGVLLQLKNKISNYNKSIGIDIWNKADQSNNKINNTKRIIENNNLSNKIDIKTINVKKLPFKDEEFDLVVSSLCFHNIKIKSERESALMEAVRVLNNKGTMIIVDTGHNKKEYIKTLKLAGMNSIISKHCGFNGWWTGPWMSTYSIVAKK